MKFSLVFIFSIVLSSISTQAQETYRLQSSELPENTEAKIQLKTIQKLKANLSSLSSGELKSIQVPTTNTNTKNFTFSCSSVLSPQLQKKFPSVRTYIGYSPDNPRATLMVSDIPQGIYVQGTGPLHAFSIAPEIPEIEKKSLAQTKNLRFAYDDHQCMNVQSFKTKGASKTTDEFSEILQSPKHHRRFRIAIAATAEYSIYHIQRAGKNNASPLEKKAAVLGAIATALTQINAIFSRELNVSFELIDRNDELIFLDSKTDNLSNDSTYSLIHEGQDIIDKIIGYEAYDIGHTFSTSGGGLAEIGSLCSMVKGMAVTGLAAPVGDAFVVDFLAHELGHQLGANHIHNNNNQRVHTTSVEPGNGSTIMGYAGAAGPNVQGQSDSYFNGLNLQEMLRFLQRNKEESGCGYSTPTTNTTPIVAPATEYYIPVSTFFSLSAEAKDPDGDALTYSWEQQDPESAVMPPKSTSETGPLFRSLPPSSETIRYFPGHYLRNEQDLENVDTQWEVLPDVPRELNFLLTVRDNKSTGGKIAFGGAKIHTVASEPFLLVSQQENGIRYLQGQTVTVRWTVGQTRNAPINTENVRILLSYDNGESYTVWEPDTANDGVEQLVIPEGKGGDLCRVKIEAKENIYFTVNTIPFEISTISREDFKQLNRPVVLFPNPTQGKDVRMLFDEEASDTNPVHVELFSLTGASVFSQRYNSGYELTIPMQNVAAGTYIASITYKGKITTHKVLHR